MRKFWILSIICVLVLSANQVVALSYTDPFPFQVWRSTLSSARISEAKLLQSYVLRYQEKIQLLYQKYHDDTSQAMSNADKTLDAMSLALKRIQQWTIHEEDATKIMQSVVKDLKTLNIRMKVYLEQEKLLFTQQIEKHKEKYVSLGKRVSKILDSIIDGYTRSFWKKKKLSEKEKDIIRSLLIIREENNKIKSFQDTSFWSEDEMKIYFKKIIKKIREQMLIIKDLSR